MATALICLVDPVAVRLDRTLLWRGDLQRQLASSTDEARRLIVTVRPALLVMDRDLPGAEALIRDIRSNERLRSMSIVVAAPGDMRASEITLLEVGANAILRLPAGPEWDERLARLARVPQRAAVRVPVHLQVEGRTLLDLASADGTILNLSANGMLLECGRPLELWTEMDFSFQLPGTHSTIAGRGRVVRLAGTGRFGVEFLDLPSAARDALERLRA